MQTLHRLAGVQEASDNSPHGAPVSPRSPPGPPPPPKDYETPLPQRASLPLNRKPSHRSFRSTKSNSRPLSHISGGPTSPSFPPGGVPPTPRLPPEHQTASHHGGLLPRTSNESARAESTLSNEQDEEDDEFAWGPSHPCFPHPNPHCDPSGPEYSTTRVIRVKRDWLATGDLYPQYANLYPEILDPLVSDSEFRLLVSTLNSITQRAFSPFTTRAWADSILGALTGYVWEDLGLTGAKSGEKELERFVDNWNREQEKQGREVRVVQLRRTGFMSLDFVVPDPGIDMEEDRSEEGQDFMQALQQSAPVS